MSLKPGTEIGNYRISAPLGEGGMGVVFVVEHRLLDRKFALKLLRPELSSDRERVAGFLKEARAVSRVSHEHVVDVTDVGTTSRGQCYYVMELLSGESLGRRLRLEGPWPVERALHVGVQIAEALSACHAAGVVHRDLKPDNVFLVRKGGDPDFVKLLDFGVVKMVDPPPDGAMRTSHPTREGTVVGTPQYMSPEQCRGRREIDHRSDLYSLGIVLYRMVMGRVPFDSDDWADVLIQQATAPLPSMAARRPDLPPEFERIVERAVAKEQRDRWQSAAAMRQAMLELLALLVGTGAAAPGARRDDAVQGGGERPAPGPLVTLQADEPGSFPRPPRGRLDPASVITLTPLTPSIRPAGQPPVARRRNTFLAASLLGAIVVAAGAPLLWPTRVHGPPPGSTVAARSPAPAATPDASGPVTGPAAAPAEPAPAERAGADAGTAPPGNAAPGLPGEGSMVQSERARGRPVTVAPADRPGGGRKVRAQPAAAGAGRRHRPRRMSRDDVFDID